LKQQQSGEDKAEKMKELYQKTLPFVSPYYWSGFVSQGMA
jgi:CHAT domain-containing protein